MQVKYTGRSNVRVVSQADLRGLGVEDVTYAELSFPRNELVEVPDNIGHVLTTHPGFNFQFSEPFVEPEVDAATVDAAPMVTPGVPGTDQLAEQPAEAPAGEPAPTKKSTKG